MDDTISREAARRAMRKLYTKEFIVADSAYNMAIDQADDVIRKLPSAERQGRWIEAGVLYHDTRGFFYGKRCSVCNELSDFKSHYCPNCGARMEASE